MTPAPPGRGATGARDRAPVGSAPVAALAAAVVLLGPAPLLAQSAPDAAAEGRAPPRVEAAIFGGALAPLARLTADPRTFETEVSSSGLLGAEVLWWTGGRIGLGTRAVWAPAELSLIPTDFTGALPDDLGDADYLAASLDLRYRLPVPPEAGLLRPYLALGAGLRRLQVDPIASPEVSDATDPTATLAAGSHVRLARGLALRFEIRDRLSLYRSPESGESRVQNDLGITVGLAVALAFDG